MNFFYKKSDALVEIKTAPKSILITVAKENECLDMQITRDQDVKSKTRMRTVGELGTSIQTTEEDIFAKYKIDTTISDQRKSFEANFLSQHNEYVGGKKAENVSLEKGIPPKEYENLCSALSEQNSGMAQIFKDYILDSEGLKSCVNMRESMFNRKLQDFMEDR